MTITLEHLHVRLGRKTVVQGINAVLTPGSLIGVIGPNGAGKSTLVRALLGLIPPSRGNVLIDGRPVSAMKRRDIARAIAYLPQGQALHWPLSVERLVALGRLPHLAPMSRIGAEDATVIDEALARADVMHLRHKPATELSGGERARALLARALAVRAPGLIADEPLAALDPGHQIDVMELLAHQAAQGALVIAVLHDLTMAARYCDRLLLLDAGTLVADGAPLDVLTQDRLGEVYGISALVTATGELPMIVPLRREANRDFGNEWSADAHRG